MNRPRRSSCPAWAALGCSVLTWLALWSWAPAAAASRSAERELRVLLIGNSYTQFNLLPQLLRHISESQPGRAPLTVDAVVHGGFTLRDHLEQGDAAARIRRGHYDLVVLQGHSLSAVNDPFELEQSVRLFDRMIDRTGAKTVLYATWPRRPGTPFYRTQSHVRSFDDMASTVHGAYARLANRLNTRLAPVGRAFQRAVATTPSLSLYQPDGSHPTPAGSFLAACVLYGTLTGQDPRNTHFRPDNVSTKDARVARNLAAAALRPVRVTARPTLAGATTTRRSRNTQERTARP